MKAKVILATILILAASCVKNEVREVSIHGDGQILYNPAPLRSMTTKADVPPTFPTSSTFGSCAWYLPGDNKWDDHHAAAATDPVAPTPYIPKTEISYNLVIPNDFNSGVWRNNDKSYYWPMNGSLTFISWSPYELVDNPNFDVTPGDGVIINGWEMKNTPGYGIKTQATAGKSSETDPKVDILLSYTKDCTRNTANGKVPIVFSHLLCKVKIVATLAKPLGDGEKPWEVTSVTLSNIYTKANYSTYVEDGSNKIKLSKLWRDQSAPKSYWINYEGANKAVGYGGDDTIIFPETLFLPQFLSGKRDENDNDSFPMIIIECKNGVGEKKTLKGLLFNRNASSLSVWNQGRSITYYVTLGDEDTYIDFDAKVEENDWTYSSGDGFNVDVGKIINGK